MNLFVDSIIRLDYSQGWRVICENVYFKKVCSFSHKYQLKTSLLKLKCEFYQVNMKNFI